MEYTQKFRIDPTEEQKTFIQRTFGCVRFVYNHYLAKRKVGYQERKETMNYYTCSSDMTSLKKELAWLKEVDATALQSSLRNLETAFGNFFQGVKGRIHLGNISYPSVAQMLS